MEWLSPYLVVIIVAWAVANAIKMAINFIKQKKISKKPILSTGGMPSAHTAIVVGLATIIELRDGLGSVTFAISFVLAVIVMTDAIHVRRAVGEQGIAIRKLLLKTDKKPHFAKGHSLPEMIVGAVIGIVAGITTFYII